MTHSLSTDFHRESSLISFSQCTGACCNDLFSILHQTRTKPNLNFCICSKHTDHIPWYNHLSRNYASVHCFELDIVSSVGFSSF
jgi:hypothetical protein